MPEALIEPLLRLAEQKLTIPASRAEYPLRVRVLDALDEAHPIRVVALVAPAGYGKSTVLEQWIGRSWQPGTASWLSLDERDDDPVRFWSYLSEAVDRLGVDVDRRLLVELRDDPEAVDELVDDLTNRLGGLDHEHLIVLDDLHRIASDEVLRPLGRLVESLPPNTTLAVTTRLPLPWATRRWQAGGQLATLDQAVLAFGVDEIEAALRPVLGSSPDDARLERIQQRTEGWPVAIELLAQSIRRAHDPVAVLARFDGTDRVIADYLLEEVLDGISPRLHRFLLDISVVETFCADLAEAIMGEPCGDLIEQMRAEHLFVIELDDRREWMRLHHLIRDLLLADLAAADPTRRQQLSRRAAGWLRAQGHWSPAIEQLIEGADFGEALELVAASVGTYQAEGRTKTLLALVERIPIDEIERRPAIAGTVAMAFSAVGRVAEAVGWLDVAERGGRTEGDEADLALATFYVERGRGHEIEALRAIERIERLAAEARSPEVRNRAASMTGPSKVVVAVAAEFLGRDDDRRAALSELDHRRDDLGPVATLAVDPLIARLAADDGELDEAFGRAQLGLERGRRAGQAPAVLAHAHLALAKVAWARGDLEQAESAIRDVDRYAIAHISWLRTLRGVVAAEVFSSLGRHDRVAEILDYAWIGERSSPTPPNSRAMVAAWGGFLAAVHGQPDVATHWWEQLDRLDSTAELDDGVWARRALFAGRSAEVVDRFGPDGDGLPGRPGPHVRCGLALIAALDETDDERARPLAERIAAYAEDHGLIQPVIDDGRAACYLRVAVPGAGSGGRHGNPPSAASAADERAPVAPVELEAAQAAMEAAGLVDPLSPRELEVVPLLPSRLSNQEIASHLYVSLNTVKTHLKHVYRKLDAANRDEAIERCRALGLL